MSNIILLQIGGTESVSISIIEALYNIAINSNANSSFNGTLFVSKAYQDQVDYLNEHTGLSITCNAWYVRLEDPVVKQILLSNISGNDGFGITTTEAANTVFGDVFKNNTQIQTFNSFDKFTAQNNSATYDFSGCTNLTLINLSNVSTMKQEAFANCISLYRVASLGPISMLPTEAFSGCTSLTSFTFPSTLKEIGLSCFGGCTNLIIDLSDVTNIQTFSGAAWGRLQYSTWIKSSDSSHTGAQITGDNLSSTACTYVGSYAFNTTSFKTINLPNLSHLGICAFSHNSLLEEVISLGNITTVSDPGNTTGWRWGVLADCPNLRKVKLPETLTSLEDEFFMGDRSLEEVNIPLNCTSIGTNAFTGHDGFPSLSSLHTIVCRPTTPPTLNSSLPNNSNLKIYVPDASISAYLAASGWSSYSSKIVGISTYTGDL